MNRKVANADRKEVIEDGKNNQNRAQRGHGSLYQGLHGQSKAPHAHRRDDEEKVRMSSGRCLFATTRAAAHALQHKSSCYRERTHDVLLSFLIVGISRRDTDFLHKTCVKQSTVRELAAAEH